MTHILRYAAFTDDPSGGNPAGVVLDATGLSDTQMQQIAADVGFSETAFLVPRQGERLAVRYFSPVGEVAFSGHATIASGVAYADRHGPGTLVLETRSGEVEVRTTQVGGVSSATLVSVAPAVADLAEVDLAAILSALRWRPDDLDTRLPPRTAYAGAWHPIIAAATRERLAALDYDMDALARAQPLPAGRGSGRPGDGGRCRSLRRIPARAPPHRRPCDDHRAPG